MNHGWIYRDRVKVKDAGQTVLDYYTQKYRHSSPEQWQARIESEQIFLNGKAVFSDTLLCADDSLTYHRPPWQEPEVPLQFEIIYEDRDLSVVNKPSGLPVMPGGGFLEHTLLWQLKKHYPQTTPVPIHRLGRGTSGLMLLGRSPLAKSDLARQMRYSSNEKRATENRQLRKVYRALVAKNTIADRLTIEQPIGRLPHPVLGYIYGATSEGKFAKSECRVIRRYNDRTLVEVEILTGRPHQIRIHLATVGYPLLGDPLYIAGGAFAPVRNGDRNIPVPGDCGYYLHAYQLSFIHPRSQQKLHFECPLPQNWLAFLEER